MVVAVIAVRVVKPLVYHVVDVVTVRNRLVPATRAVRVDCTVPSGSRSVPGRPLVVDRKRVLVDVIAVRMMQMPAVQIVDVIAVAHSDVPATRTVGVDVIVVCIAGHARDCRPWCNPRETPHSR